MLEGKKPFAAFYWTSIDSFDPYEGQDFKPYVQEGVFSERQFIIEDYKPNLDLIYNMFSLSGQEWRMDNYEKLKRELHHVNGSWSDDMEMIEGILYGYTLEQCMEYQAYRQKLRDQNIVDKGSR